MDKRPKQTPGGEFSARPYRMEIAPPAEVADWALNHARASTLMRLAFGRGCKKVEIAKVLGATPGSVSNWSTGSATMSRPVRVHVLRIIGIAWYRGAWVRVRTFTEGEPGYSPRTKAGKRHYKRQQENPPD